MFWNFLQTCLIIILCPLMVQWPSSISFLATLQKKEQWYLQFHIINTSNVGHQGVFGALPLFFKCNKAEVFRLVVLRLVNRPYYFRNCAKLERIESQGTDMPRHKWLDLLKVIGQHLGIPRLMLVELSTWAKCSLMSSSSHPVSGNFPTYTWRI